MDLLDEKEAETIIIKKESSESSFEVNNKSLDEIPEEEVDWRGNKINQNQNQKQLEKTWRDGDIKKNPLYEGDAAATRNIMSRFS